MIKLVIITPDFFPSKTGYANAVLGLCQSLSTHSVVSEITVYTTKSTIVKKEDTQYLNKQNIKREELLLPGLYTIFNKLPFIFGYLYLALFHSKKILRLINTINKKRYPIVLCETMEHAWLSLLLSKTLKAKVVTRLHGAFPEAATLFSKELKYGKKFIKYLMKTSFIATTTYHYIEFLRNHNSDHRLLRNKSFFILPNTVPYEKPVNKGAIYRKNKVSILQLGRMDNRGFYYKGFEDSIKALCYLETKENFNFTNQIEYVIIGDGTRANHVLNKLKILKNIKYQYFKHLNELEVKEKIKASNIILMPSRNEGMSMFALEAVSMGKPLIYTSNTGLRELAINNYNGLSVNPFNYIEIANHIKYFVDNHSEIIRMSENSISHYNTNFSNKVVANYFLTMLKYLEIE